MEVRKGYKKTEIGILPEDWEIKSFNELFTPNGGLSASREQLSEDGICYLHYGDIHLSKKPFIDVDADYINIPKLPVKLNNLAKQYLLNDGDIVFVDASEDDEGSSKHVVIRNPHGTPFIAGLHTIVLKPKDNTVCKLLREYCFQTEHIKKQFLFYSVGTKVTGISKSNIIKLIIPLPPALEEQTAIANALSDADALISSLEKLIAKKRAIKQGAMQELLTGKKRLAGFTGEWGENKIGDAFTILAGGDVIKEAFSEISDEKYKYPIYSNAIEKDGLYGFSEISRYPANCITVTARGTIGNAHTREKEFDAIGRVLVLIPKMKISCRFVTEYINNYITFSIESTGVPQLTAPQISKYNFILPPIEEQISIAQVLSDMDAEITALEAKLAKYRAVKQGMMQELLTGKTRLI